jgi:hypothetical protein
MTDRIARQPHGRRARAVYGAPDVHSFAWEPIFDALQLRSSDVLLDVGCGGVWGVKIRCAFPKNADLQAGTRFLAPQTLSSQRCRERASARPGQR